jgi:hypothetical protein
MLPWRCATDIHDLCIAEPYHPDRVAGQFTLRQQLPYAPLPSLYTTEDTGVAYAYWQHLLRQDQGEFQYLLNGKHEARCKERKHEVLCTVAWAHWWVGFMNPFKIAFRALSSGISNGQNYHSEKIKFLRDGERFMIPRKLSEEHFVVVKEVTVRGQRDHIAAIKRKEKEIMDCWTPILSGFLTCDKPHVDSQKVSYIYIFYHHCFLAFCFNI